jgi:hypothetical protein
VGAAPGVGAAAGGVVGLGAAGGAVGGAAGAGAEQAASKAMPVPETIQRSAVRRLSGCFSCLSCLRKSFMCLGLPLVGAIVLALRTGLAA